MIPMCRNEENYAAGEEYGSEDKGDKALPAKPGRLFVFCFQCAHASDETGVAFAIKNSSGLPAR